MNIIIHDKNMEPATVMEVRGAWLRELQERGGILMRVTDQLPQPFFGILESTDLVLNDTFKVRDYEIRAFRVEATFGGWRAQKAPYWIYQCDMPAESFRFPPALMPGQVRTHDDCVRVIRAARERTNQLSCDASEKNRGQ